MNLNVAIPQQLDLATDKKATIERAKEFVELLIEDGGDGIALLAQANRLMLIAETMIAAAKKGTIEEVRRYGREGLTRYGVTMTVGESGVKYDYTSDPTWKNLKEAEVKAGEARKAHETYLKTIPYEGRIHLDWTTGEEYRAYPPAKRAGETVFCEIK